MGRRSDSSSDHRDDPYLSASVAQLLDDLAARTPAPGGGAAAALTCAMAAALVEMATSFASAQGLEAVRDRAHAIREQASGLAYADGGPGRGGVRRDRRADAGAGAGLGGGDAGGGCR